MTMIGSGAGRCPNFVRFARAAEAIFFFKMKQATIVIVVVILNVVSFARAAEARIF